MRRGVRRRVFTGSRAAPCPALSWGGVSHLPGAVSSPPRAAEPLRPPWLHQSLRVYFSSSSRVWGGGGGGVFSWFG